jgi:class 3 adenylate cyclase
MTRTADENAVSAAQIEAWERAGLYDPADAKARERLELLEYLAGIGATTEQMAEANERAQLIDLSSELRHGGGERLSIQQIAEFTGQDPEILTRLVRSAGLPIEDQHTLLFRVEDKDACDVFTAGREMFGDEQALQFTRVTGAAMAAIADAAMASFGSEVAARLESEGATELERAKVTEFACDLLLDQVPIALNTLFFHHVQAAIRRSVASGIGLGHQVARLAVAFVDLVGSTALAQQLDTVEFSRVISRFEQHAVERSAAAGGRVVKTIGDEVMIVTSEVDVACEVALQLCEYAEADPVLPPLRGAVAFGDVTPSVGDFYGLPVNLAARMVKIAEPHDVLITADAAEVLSLSGKHEHTSIGLHALRGVAEPIELFRLKK